MVYSFSCPVPSEQRPINEYMQLVQSNFFNWPLLEESLLKRKLMSIFIICFFVCLPFSSLFYSINQAPIKLIVVNMCVTNFVLAFLILRLFLAWTYIQQRLQNSTIFYEESGWYDGRVWVKSKNILVQDRLVCAYQVLPVINKLKKTLLTVTCLLGFLILILIFS